MRLYLLALLLLPATALAWRDEYHDDYAEQDYHDRPVIIIQREDNWGNLAELQQRERDSRRRADAETSRNLIEILRLREEIQRNREGVWSEPERR